MHSITRRQALRTAGSLIAASALAREPKKPKRVVVVGGGIGGLSCAYELMERGHDVTLLEASRRTGGHVKTIRDPLPDGLYADVGAEHFTHPGYDHYRRYVEKFDLPVLPWARRQNMYKKIDGQWFTEAQLVDPDVLRGFGFNRREIEYMCEHGFRELPMLYFEKYAARFKDEYQPFGVGMDELDHQVLGDVMAGDGLSAAAVRWLGAAPRKPGASITEASALFRIWQMAIPRMRGLPVFKREVFHLKGGNQLLPDVLAAKLGARVRKHSEVTAIDRSNDGVSVHYRLDGKEDSLSADYAVLCVSPLVLPRITITPAWPEKKAFALMNTPMGMQSRVLLVCKDAFWKSDNLPGINLETGDARMSLVYQTATDVSGSRCLLMGSGNPTQTPEDTIAAFRSFYPGLHKDSIEQCMVHQWPLEEPLAVGCERHAFAFGQLANIWPHLIEPVGRIYFAGAAYDNLPWGQDAATRSANRVAAQIDAA